MPMGQGIATSYAQLVVDMFGVDIAKVKVVTGDTDRGKGFGSAGSRSLFTAGSAIDVASKKTVEAARDLAAEALEAAAADIEYREGELRVAGTDRAIDLFELAGRQPERRIFVDSTTQGRAARAGPTAATSARSRSTPTPAPSRSSPTPRSTTSAASSVR